MRWTGWMAALAMLAGCAGPVAPQRAHRGIIGGEETTGWPAVVAYLFGGGTGLCTGTVIGPSTVLTAAHCGAYAAEGDEIFFGSSIYEAGDTVAVETVDLHPDYQDLDATHDLAVVTLADPVDVEPIVLNAETIDDSLAGTMLHAVGYGNADLYTGETMGIKRETDVELIDVHGHLIFHETPGQNTCSGDSGGPILLEQNEGWVLVGVASFVYPADDEQDYCTGGGGDVRVDSHMEWLGPFVGMVADDDDDDDDDDDTSVTYLEDHSSSGCAASIASRAGSAGGALLVLLAALVRRRSG